MRIQLIFQKIGAQPAFLPFNYQYPLSSWIYKVLARASSSYADFLHSKGYQLENSQKTFKFFTFSDLRFKDFRIHNNPATNTSCFAVLSDQLSITLSFYVDQAAENFIKGIFAHQQLSLGDKNARADFEVALVEALPTEIKQETVRFKTISPMVVTLRRENGKDLYLRPDDGDFPKIFASNLKDKYVAIEKNQPGNIFESEVHFKLLTAPEKIKSRLVTIKADSSTPVSIRGFYSFEFEVTAPKPLLEIGLKAGFGSKNSMGMGCCEVMK